MSLVCCVLSLVPARTDGEKLLSFGHQRSTSEVVDRDGPPFLGNNIKLQAKLKGHTSPVRSLAFHPDGKFLVSGSVDKTVRLWRLGSKYEVGRWKTSSPVWSVTFSPDGKILAALCSNGELHLWEFLTRKKIGSWSVGRGRWFRKLAFHPNSRILAVTDGPRILLWDVATHKSLATLRADTRFIRDMEFSPCGKFLVSAGQEDKTLRVWDVDKRKMWGTFHVPNKVNIYVHFGSGGGTLVATSGGPKVVAEVWDLRSKELIRKFNQKGWLRNSDLHPGGNVLAFDDVHSLKLIDLNDGTELAQFRNHRRQLLCVVFGPKGHFLATGSADETVCVYTVGDFSSRNESTSK